MGIGRKPGGSLGKWASLLGASTAGTTGHVFGGALHTADTLANLNALISDDTLGGLGGANTWTEAQTFSTGVILNPDAVFIFPTSSSVPTISSSGQAIWDSTHEALLIANGSSGRHFIPSEGIAGQGSMDTAGALTINADHSGSSHINLDEVHTWTAVQTFSTGIVVSGGKLDIGAQTLVGNGGTAGITISANGEVSMTSQPCVLADNSVDDTGVTGNGTLFTVELDNEIFDQNGDFSSTNDTFTAPVTGKYLVCGVVRAEGGTTAATIAQLQLIASNRTLRVLYDAGEGSECGGSISSIIDMDAADTLTLGFVVSGESTDIIRVSASHTHLSIKLAA